MASKKELLKNLLNFTASEIAEAVRNGDVTLYELSKESNGAFTPLLKRQVQLILDNPQTDAPATAGVDDCSKNTSSGFAASPQHDSSQASGQTEKVDANRDSEEDLSPLSESTVTNNSNKGMFKRPFSFKGRIRRTEYGISILIYFLWNSSTRILMLDSDPSLGACIFVLISLIPMTWFLWAQNCKRCHDRGNSGWYQLIPFYFFVLLFGDGEPFSNSYGDNPKIKWYVKRNDIR